MMGSKSGLAFPDDDLLRRMRNWLVHHPGADLSELEDLLAEFGRSPSWREASAVLELLGHRSPGGAPAFLADFLAQLADARGATAVLDPFATSPTLIAALAERVPNARAVALTPHEPVERLGRSVAPTVDWRLGMPSETLAQLDGRFDFIASAPPLGMKRGSAPIRPGLGEYANSLMVDAAEMLVRGGALAFLLADGFFFRTDAQRTREELQGHELRIEAAISVEGGLRPLRDIPTSLVLVTHGEPLDELFVGRLDSVIEPAVLMQNMIERKGGEFLQLGVLYPAGRYRGWQALLSERDLLVGLGNVRGPVVELGEIALGFSRLPRRRG